MSYLKTLMDPFKLFANSIANAKTPEKKADYVTDEIPADAEGDEKLIKHLSQKFIEVELSMNKSKKNWEVFSQHQQQLICCLKRYEDAYLNQLEKLQKEQAKSIFKALQNGEEISPHSGSIINKDEYINGLKKVILYYCQKHILTMGDFMEDIPEHYCDGKNASTFMQSRRKDTSKKRWKNFEQQCRDNDLHCFSSEILFDTTLWGSAKHGFMLGRNDIICLGGEPEKFRVSWSNVKEFWHYKGYLYVNDYKTGFVANDSACELLELLEEHYKKTKRSEGNLLLEYLGYDITIQESIDSGYQNDVLQFVG